MKSIYFIISGLLASFMCVAQTADSKAAFLPDSSEFYQEYGLIATADIEKLLSSPADQEFLGRFTKTYGPHFDSESQYKLLTEKNVDEWEMELFELRNEQIALLRKEKAGISPELYAFLEKEVKYNYWHLLFAYPILRSNLDTKQTRLVSLPQVMTKNFNFNDLKESNQLVSKSFRKLLPFAVTYFNSEERGFRKYADMVESTMNKAEYAQKKLSGDVLDYYLATLLTANKEKISSSSARYLVSQIENQQISRVFKNGFVADIMKKEAAEAKKTAEAKPVKPKSTYPQLVDMSSKTFDFSKYKGKVVYVDFWASWCGPCRKEFPYSKKMHEALSDKEKKNIVFLYISIDENQDVWKDAVKSLGLDSFENGYPAGDGLQGVVQQYQISGIPRYMIIDKNGVIVKPDARRPSDPETMQELLDLTK